MTLEELLKEVGEPVGYLYDWIHSSATGRPDEKYTGFTEDKGFAIRDKHENCRDVFTSNQVAAAILKATKSLEDQLAKVEQRVAEACALQVATETRFHWLDAARVAKEIRSGEYRKFMKGE